MVDRLKPEERAFVEHRRLIVTAEDAPNDWSDQLKLIEILDQFAPAPAEIAWAPGHYDLESAMQAKLQAGLHSEECTVLASTFDYALELRPPGPRMHPRDVARAVAKLLTANFIYFAPSSNQSSFFATQEGRLWRKDIAKWRNAADEVNDGSVG